MLEKPKKEENILFEQKEIPKLSGKALHEARKFLVDLKNEEIKKEEIGEITDPDLLLLQEDDMKRLTPEQLYPFGRFLFYKQALKAGLEEGDPDMKGLAEDMISDLTNAIVFLRGVAERRVEHLVEAERKRKAPDFNDKEKNEYIRRVGNEDYFLLYHRWLQRKFEALINYAEYALHKNKERIV